LSDNLYAMLASRFAQAGGDVCLELDDGTRYSYAELDAESARCANLLASLGLERGDRVAVQVEKSAQVVFLYLGCLRAGLAYLPLNTAYREGEVSYFVGDAEQKMNLSVNSSMTIDPVFGASTWRNAAAMRITPFGTSWSSLAATKKTASK